MFPMGDGPFLAQRGPFITAAGGGAFVVGATAEATGTTEITFTLTTSLAYAGVEWGIDPALTWTAFDASQSTSHIIIIDGADGVVAATTYAWRSYATNDPLDAPGNRVYGVGGTVVVPSAYDADAQAVIDQWKVTSPALNATWQDAINALVVAAKANGYWTNADRFFVTAADVETNALLNWKAPTGTAATNVSSTAFAAKQGFTGDSTADYIDSNMAANAGTNFLRDANGAAYYVRANNATRVYGGESGTTNRHGDAAPFSSRINGANLTVTTNTAAGVRGYTRSSSVAVAVYSSAGGTLASSGANASAAQPANNMLLLSANGSYGGSQISFWWLGGTISQAIVDDMNTDVAAFLASVASA